MRSHESSIQAIGNDAPAKAANTDKSAVSALFVLLPAGPKEPLQAFGARCTVDLSPASTEPASYRPFNLPADGHCAGFCGGHPRQP
jgi:hypothetical protein